MSSACNRDPLDCSPPGSSVHGFSQARVLEWVAISFPRGSSWHRDLIHVSVSAAGFITTEPPAKSKMKPLGRYQFSMSAASWSLYIWKVGQAPDHSKNHVKTQRKVSTTSQRKMPQKKSALPTSWSWSSSLQNYEGIHNRYLWQPGCSTFFMAALAK